MGKKKIETNQIEQISVKTPFKLKLAACRNEYGYLALAAFIPAVLFFLIYLARGIYPFGDSTVLVLDLNGQYVYFFEALKDTVLEGGSLLYSWSRALGGEFLGLYAYYIASPLSYLICLFPDTMTQEFLLILFMIKAALCGLTMGFYLHKHSVSKNKFSVVAFATLYAMSAYCVVHQSNTMWIDAVMWLPLVTYGLEELIKFGKYKMFAIFLSLTVASNFYIGYMVCIFVFIYFFFYLLAYKDNNVNNPRLEKNHMGRALIRTGFFSLIAIGMAAVMVLGAYYSLQFGKNEFTDPSWEINLRFDFFDVLFKLLPSSYDTVRIDGLPFIYCGLLTVILAPLFFCSKKISVREKIACAIFLMIFILSFMISVVDLVWHGFQKPQWLNNRYSFMFCFFLIYLAFRAFEEIEEFSTKSLACVSAFIFFFVIILQNFAEAYKDKLVSLTYGPKEEDFQVHEFATILLTIACLITYISVIAVMKRAKNRDLVATVLVGVICVEVFLSGLCNVNDFDEDVGFTQHHKYTEYQTLYAPVVDTLIETDTSFYRFEKTYHRKTNDNMALSIRGLSNSTSTLNRDTINFLNYMGYFSESHKSQYYGGTPVSDSLLGLKYIISEQDLSNMYGEPFLSGEDYAEYMDMTLDELKEATKTSPDLYKNLTAADINVYLNKYALSLAFAADDDIYNIVMKTYNKWVSKDDDRYCENGFTSPFVRMNAIITAILGENEMVEVFKPATQNGPPQVSSGVTASTSSDHYKFEGKNGDITYSYTVPEGVELYLFFPAYYNRKIKISSPTMPIFDERVSNGYKADGIEYLEKCNERIVDLGYTTGTEYELKVTINNSVGDKGGQFYTMLDDSFIYYIDVDVLEDAFTRIQKNQFIIEDYKEDDLKGKITTEKADQTILTSIPYDKGWEVYVDGKRVETTEALDALVSFKIDDAGEHTLRLKYSSSAFKAGLVIMLVSLSGFILIIIFEDKLRRLKLVKAFFVVKDGSEEQVSISGNKKQ